MPLSSVAPPDTLARPALLVMSVLIAGSAVGYAIATGRSILLIPAIAVLLVLRWPVQVALGTYAFLVPFEQFAVVGQSGSGITPALFAELLTLATLSAVGLMYKRFERPPVSAIWWSLFVAWGAITIAWSVAPEVSTQRLPTAILLLVLYVLVTSFRITRDEFNAISLFTIAGGTVAAVVTLAETFSGMHLTGTSRGTLAFGGTEADPNSLAACLVVPFALALGQILGSRGPRQLPMIATALSLVLGVVVTGSRGGMLGLLVCVFVFLLRMKIDKRIVVVVLCVALLLAFIPSAFLTRLTKTDDAGAGRLGIWATAFHALPHYVVQGAGWDNFAVIFSDYSGGAQGMVAHNLWLGLLIEVGFLGVLFLILAMRSQLRNLHGSIIIPLEAGCWGFLTVGMFLGIIWRKAFWLAWILLALATRLQHRTGTEVTEAVE
jgi:O-antigen ligase